MQQLDDTDAEILGLLREDARRPYSEIGEIVGLSGPAVSDRVSRLEAAGVITGFSVTVDRSQLRAGVPLFVQVQSPDDLADLTERVADADAVEHRFTTAAGDLWFVARGQVGNVRPWLDSVLEGADYDVTLLDSMAWNPSLADAAFGLTCVECNNTVDSEGRSTRLDGDVYHFCCPSCEQRFVERYERFDAEA
jgi:DNA-binding Lrp family transcriptional regulator/YHS domain-containing protein